jgi:phage gp16-like protein
MSSDRMISNQFFVCETTSRETHELLAIPAYTQLNSMCMNTQQLEAEQQIWNYASQMPSNKT